MPKGYSKRNQGGWKHSEASLALMSKNRCGITVNEKNHKWAGMNVTYHALHTWIDAHFIKAKKCNFCGINPGLDVRGRSKMHWANKTGKYLRVRTDWLCLCAKCHRNYDFKIKKVHRYKR